MSTSTRRVMTVIVTFKDGSTEQYSDTPLASGAQGSIYLSQGGQPLSVVKLYPQDPRKDVERKDRIEKLINNFNPTKDDPYWVQFFTWPERMVVKPAIGY